jgi:N-carbamoylputrescine amidase
MDSCANRKWRTMTERGSYRVGLLQISCSPDPDANLDKAADWVRQAARQGAQIVCLPELFRAQYFCQREDIQLFDLAEPIPGPSTERLGAVAREEGVVVIASLFERRAPGLYHNTAAILETDGSLAGIYRKMHIPDDPLYYEKFYFTPGDLGYRAFDTDVGRIGTLVCWDQWYPEGARITAMQGANVLFYPTAIGWHPAEKQQYGDAQYEAWQTIQRSHAIANGVYVAAVNRVGQEYGDIRGNRAEGPGLEFWGGSFLADPFGRILAQASHDREEILIGEVDLKHLEDVRRNWPFLRDRRIDSYAPIVHRFLDSSPATYSSPKQNRAPERNRTDDTK